MVKVDIEKLICDFLSFKHNRKDENSPFKLYSTIDINIIRGAGCLIDMALKHALRNQGLEYKNGKILSLSKNAQDIKYEEAVTNEPVEKREPDIDAMVEKYRERIMSGEFAFSAKTLEEASLRDYRNGLEDMYNKMKK